VVDFDELREKAEDLAEKHAGQVDEAIDKAAGMLGTKFGHGSEVEKGAEKLKDLLPGQGQQPGQDGGAHEGGGAHQGKGAGKHGGQHSGQHKDRHPGEHGPRGGEGGQ
jgi:hypothetical protein